MLVSKLVVTSFMKTLITYSFRFEVCLSIIILLWGADLSEILNMDNIHYAIVVADKSLRINFLVKNTA